MKASKIMTALLIAAGFILIVSGIAAYATSRSFYTQISEDSQFEDYLEKGRYYGEQGLYRDAALAYSHAVELDGTSETALLGLGESYVNMGLYGEAEETYQGIIDLNENNVSAWVDLAEMYLQQGRLEEAKNLLALAVQKLDEENLYNLHEQTEVAPPVFSLEGGSYDTYQLLHIENTSPYAVIYYTTDGSEPNEYSAIYSDGIVLSYSETTLRAKAITQYGYESEETRADYTITVPEEIIRFDNYELERQIIRTLDISYGGELYNYQLATVRDFSYVGQGNVDLNALSTLYFYQDYYADENNQHEEKGDLSDLLFLQHFPFLRSLNIAFQTELSLQGLEYVPQLEQLSLLSNGITDIEPIANLHGLKHLTLGWNQIEDVSPLSNLNSLLMLGLWGNKITDLSPLTELTKLHYFDVSDNKISDIRVVENMPFLRELWIYSNNITDISPIDILDDLTVLMWRDNPVTEYGQVIKQASRFRRIDIVN